MENDKVMKLLVLDEDVEFDRIDRFLEEGGDHPLDLDWMFRFAHLKDTRATNRGTCVTTWVDGGNGIRTYPQISGLDITYVEFKKVFPAGTRVLVAQQDLGDGAGGVPEDTDTGGSQA